MDISDVLNGIQHFFENIVPKAYYSADWNEEAINIACQWAQFCEKVYMKYTGENAEKFDALLHSISGELKSFYVTAICFQDLKYSLLLLAKAFFNNPNIENAVIRTVFQNRLDVEQLSEGQSDVLAFDTLFSNLIESIRPISIKESDRSLYYEIKADFFLNYLKNSLHHLPTEEQETRLSSAFETLCENDENIMILFHVLKHAAASDDNETVEIQQFCMNWMLLKLYDNKTCELAQYLLKQSPAMLRSFATKHKEFSEYYLETITRCVDCLKENEECETGRLATASKLTFSFDQVLSHLQNILNIEDDFGKNSQEYILEQLNIPANNSTWKKLVSQLPALKNKSFLDSTADKLFPFKCSELL